jgi:hypothetical protein
MASGKRLLLVLLSCICLNCYSLRAQTASILIRVVDGRNGHAVVGEHIVAWIRPHEVKAIDLPPIDKNGITKLEVKPTDSFRI